MTAHDNDNGTPTKKTWNKPELFKVGAEVADVESFGIGPATDAFPSPTVATS
jgi:hypothetical protein